MDYLKQITDHFALNGALMSVPSSLDKTVTDKLIGLELIVAVDDESNYTPTEYAHRIWETELRRQEYRSEFGDDDYVSGG